MLSTEKKGSRRLVPVCWLFCLIFFLSFQVPTVHGDQLEKTWQTIEVWQLLNKVDSQT